MVHRCGGWLSLWHRDLLSDPGDGTLSWGGDLVVLTSNSSGDGPWSEGMSFTVTPSSPPGAATLVSPYGTITTTTPTYTWNAVSDATWYEIWVNDSTGNKIKQWYTAAEAHCAPGEGTYWVEPGTVLNPGVGVWWILTWNSAGYGPWSDPLTFTVNP